MCHEHSIEGAFQFLSCRGEDPQPPYPLKVHCYGLSEKHYPPWGQGVCVPYSVPASRAYQASLLRAESPSMPVEKGRTDLAALKLGSVPQKDEEP